ncbi:MAG: serine/threonine-protein phosphatase [Bdellovibrionales bacterium]|nr:serine/threonine-protein phosphatase [Bdellovibrionales bacterium]
MGAARVQANLPETVAVALIVAKDESFNRAIIKHLWNNGIETLFTADLNEAQNMVVQHLPDFIFIPYDHPNFLDVATFARKFARLKSAQFIAYAETETANAVARLAHYPTKRALHPPLAGESFLMHIRAVLSHLPNFAHLRLQKKSLLESMRSQLNFDPGHLGQAIQQSLIKISRPDLTTTPERIGVTSRLCCAIFEVHNFKGYLVGVHGGELETELQFFEAFKAEFLERMREKGYPSIHLEFKQFRVHRVPFSEWAQSAATLLKMAIHENREIAMALLEAPTKTVNPLGAIEQEMAPFAITDIELNVPLPVNLFMFSDTTQKFHLFLKKDRVFKSGDLAKLSDLGARQLYVPAAEVSDLLEFNLQDFLVESVENYNAEVLARELAARKRMSGELEMAKVVQDALFPANTYEDDLIKIKGLYRTSSECGGDWWFYNVLESKAYFFIGDATGHGVPAALVVSAARASAGLIALYPEMSLSLLMSILNHAIYGTSRGKILMTFILASLDLRTGEVKICNASHEPPMVFPVQNNLKMRDIITLVGKVGPRLGDSLTSTYKETSYQLQVRDRIFFYTDGIPELQNHNQEMWSEQKMIRTLLKSLQKGPGIETAITDLEAGVENHRGGRPLNDDITYFFVEFKRRLE